MDAVIWIGITVIVVIAALIAVLNSANDHRGGGSGRPPQDHSPSPVGARRSGRATSWHRADSYSGDHEPSPAGGDSGGGGYGSGGYGGSSFGGGDGGGSY